MRQYALDMLARREHSRLELERKLKTKGAPDSEVQLVLDDLIRENLQSDQRFCESYSRYRSRAGFGPRRIVQELQQRGVELSLINQYIYAETMDWAGLLFAAWQKKFANSALKTPQDYAKVKRFLLQRGFDPTSIHGLLSKVYQHEEFNQ